MHISIIFCTFALQFDTTMISLGDGIELYTEDELPKLLTIDEMRELAKSETYRVPEEQMALIGGDKPEEKYTWSIRWDKPNLLRDHLLVEECVNNYWINWKFTTSVYDPRTIAYMIYLWHHPLVWVPISKELTKERIIVGRVAEERFVKRDRDFVDGTPLGIGTNFSMLDWFAEKLPMADGSEPIFPFDYEFSSLDIIQWYYLTRNASEMYSAARKEKGKFDPSLLVPFDLRRFLFNMEIIAGRKGGAKAAQIVRLLRKDWKRITTMKFFDIGKMPAEQIEEFRMGLFEGMDYYLEQWEAETPQNSQDNAKPATFEFITELCRKEGKVETVEAELRAASKGTAHAMWKTIRINEALEYLSTQDVSAAKIYKALTAYFGELPYNERNFRDARNKR